MSGFNKVVVIGRLTRDPEMRQLPSGRPVTDLGIAVNETFKDRNGEMKEKTCFIDVVAWGKQAETCSQYLNKGSLILVDGRLQQDRWELDGKKVSKHKINADRVQFLDKKRGANEMREEATAGVSDSAPF